VLSFFQRDIDTRLVFFGELSGSGATLGSVSSKGAPNPAGAVNFFMIDLLGGCSPAFATEGTEGRLTAGACSQLPDLLLLNADFNSGPGEHPFTTSNAIAGLKGLATSLPS
jgi:hypothetical protein